MRPLISVEPGGSAPGSFWAPMAQQNPMAYLLRPGGLEGVKCLFHDHSR
jgi:hypothetical protein